MLWNSNEPSEGVSIQPQCWEWLTNQSSRARTEFPRWFPTFFIFAAFFEIEISSFVTSLPLDLPSSLNAHPFLTIPLTPAVLQPSLSPCPFTRHKAQRPGAMHRVLLVLGHAFRAALRALWRFLQTPQSVSYFSLSGVTVFPSISTPPQCVSVHEHTQTTSYKLVEAFVSEQKKAIQEALEAF